MLRAGAQERLNARRHACEAASSPHACVMRVGCNWCCLHAWRSTIGNHATQLPHAWQPACVTLPACSQDDAIAVPCTVTSCLRLHITPLP